MNKVGHQGLRMRAAKLAAAANSLQQLSGRETPFRLAFFTDQQRLADPFPIIRALPAGTAVILRDYDMPRRTDFALQLKSICANLGLLLFIGEDMALAEKIGADGVHWPSWRPPPDKAPPAFLNSAACHTADDLAAAYARGADLAFLSPVFPTKSHPGGAVLGVDRFCALAAAAAFPVLALGGVDDKNAHRIAGPNIVGFGAIGAFAE